MLFYCEIQYPSFPWFIAGVTSHMEERQPLILIRAHVPSEYSPCIPFSAFSLKIRPVVLNLLNAVTL